METATRKLARLSGLAYLAIFVFGAVSYTSQTSLGAAAMALMLAADVVLALLFYRLFRPVSQSLSLYAMALRLLMSVILAADVAVRLTAPFNAQLFDHLFNIALVIFGLDCVLIGLLIVRAPFLPKPLGLFLAMGGFCYLAVCLPLAFNFGPLLPPDALFVSYASELTLTLWLLFRPPAAKIE